MKVLFVSDAPTVGGSEVYLREMLPRLRSLGVDAEAALPLLPGNASIRKALSEAGVPVHSYRSLDEVPKAHDLYVASAWFPQSYTRYFAHFPRLIALIHDQIEVFYPLGFSRLYRLGYRLLQLPNLRQTQAVITVSEWGARWLREIHGLPRVYAVQNGVDTDKFRPSSPDEKIHLRAKYGFQRFSVLVPARMSPEKNHLAVLLTAKLLPEVDFYLVGTGELLGLWKKTARLLMLKNVYFLGRREDIPDLYRAADAMLLPTLGENQSLATLEAMASGLPVVTTNIPAQRELILDGETGLLSLPYPSELSKRILHVAAGGGRMLGKEARAFVQKYHSLDQSSKNLVDLLERLGRKR